MSADARLNATGFLLLLAVGAGTALLLPPSRVSGDLPDASNLGELAQASIKANRDYIIPDPDATLALREEAARSVRPIYDFDASLAERSTERIGRAFAYVREHLPATPEDVPAEKRVKNGRQASTKPDLVELARPHYPEFLRRLQAVVEEAEYDALARADFSPEVERAAQMLVQGVMGGEIAPNRELLLAERANGIVLRTLGLAISGRMERETRDVERIPDLAAVRLDLGRLAQGLPSSPGSTTGVDRIAMALPSELSQPGRRAAALLAASVVSPNLSFNERETRARQVAAAEAVKPVVLQYARGEKLIGDGERIEQRHLLVFRSVAEQARTLDIVQVRLGAAFFAMLLAFSVFRLARRTVRRFRPSKRDLLFLTAALIGNLALARGVLGASELLRDWVPVLTINVAVWLVPMTAGTMLVRLLRSGEASVVFALVFAPLAALQIDAFSPAIVGLLASVVAADRLGRSGSNRSALVLAGLQAGLFAACAAAALALFGGRLLLPETGIEIAATALGNGVLSPIAASIVAPLFEMVFGYTTQLRLHRLANLNHPVLKELIIRAPGTYHHSLLVGDLAAAAAERIGANALLAKVGGYFHDLGKAESPLMYSENQRNENRLDKLEPLEAAAALKRHVDAGVEAAAKARLPRVVSEFIRQHHGRAYVSDFYERALENAKREGSTAALPDEDAFRYDGPKPRSREVALVMLADIVESASRWLVNPTAERLRELVPRVIEPVVLSGQLDDCDLTLAELHRVIEVLQAAIVKVHGLARVDVLPTVRPASDAPDAATPPHTQRLVP